MDIFKTMSFDDDLSHVRKAAGGIMHYTSIAIATFNETYLIGGFGERQMINQVMQMAVKPVGYETACLEIMKAKQVEEIKQKTHALLKLTRDFFLSNKPESHVARNINEEDLAAWYYEARYSFRRIEYYTSIHDFKSAFELGCYLQIEFDSIQDEFGLKRMDLLGSFQYEQLEPFAEQAKNLENYLVTTLNEQNVALKTYQNLDEFLAVQAGKNQ